MKKLVLLILMFIALSVPAAAAQDILTKQADALNLDDLKNKLPEEASDYLDTYNKTDGGQAETALNDIVTGAGEQAGGIFKGILKKAAIIIAIALICAVASSIFEGAKKVPDFIPLAGALAVTISATGDITALMGLGTKTIADMDTLSKSLLPTIATAAMVSGSPVASSARYVATMFFSDILITIINRLLVPLTYAYVAMCAANTAIGNDALSKVSGMIKWFVTWALTGLLTIFVAYITISGAITGGVDAVTLKSAKLALSGAIPVVGSVLSDAAETIIASASIIKNTIGIAGMIGVIAICIVPFLKLGANYLIYRATGALCSIFAGNRLSDLISGIATAFGIILGMTGACALLIIISVTSAMLASGVS